jgi:hypothetical protein
MKDIKKFRLMLSFEEIVVLHNLLQLQVQKGNEKLRELDEKVKNLLHKLMNED